MVYSPIRSFFVPSNFYVRGLVFSGLVYISKCFLWFSLCQWWGVVIYKSFSLLMSIAVHHMSFPLPTLVLLARSLSLSLEIIPEWTHTWVDVKGSGIVISWKEHLYVVILLKVIVLSVMQNLIWTSPQHGLIGIAMYFLGELTTQVAYDSYTW